MEIFDYIVVGGGSAGCAMTYRLVKAGHSVLLLEAGPEDDSPYIKIPGAFIKVIGTERTWLYATTPQAAAGGRVMVVPQGRTLGGGSSVNGMIYMRGTPADYDGWRDQGCPGWGWEDVLPVFRRCEANQRFSAPLHGTDGPLPVSDLGFRHPLSLAFLQAAQELGYPYNDDFNGATQAGVGFFQTTILDGQRQSTAATYLRGVLGDRRLKVVTGAHVGRVITAGRAAVGVAFDDGSGGPPIEAGASREVILAAGALASPKILQLSGIGPADHLAEHGISVVCDLPGVGSNYHDHLDVPVYGQLRQPISLLGHDKGLRAMRHGLQYLLFRSGLLTSNVVECGAFIDTSGDGRPDIQFHIIPALVGDAGCDPLPGHGLCVNPAILRPQSRGTVRLRSRRPQDPILFDPRALSVQADVDTLVRGVKVARATLRQPSLAKLLDKELLPGEAAEIPDEVIESHVRRTAKTIYHPVGTCRMGTGTGSVVGPTLQVHGVDRLRVCDASVMPSIVSGNTNAPTIMIAERCADFILNAVTSDSAHSTFSLGKAKEALNVV